MTNGETPFNRYPVLAVSEVIADSETVMRAGTKDETGRWIPTPCQILGRVVPLQVIASPFSVMTAEQKAGSRARVEMMSIEDPKKVEMAKKRAPKSVEEREKNKAAVEARIQSAKEEKLNAMKTYLLQERREEGVAVQVILHRWIKKIKANGKPDYTKHPVLSAVDGVSFLLREGDPSNQSTKILSQKH